MVLRADQRYLHFDFVALAAPILVPIVWDVIACKLGSSNRVSFKRGEEKIMFYSTARMPVFVLLGRSMLFFLMAYLLLYKLLQMNADLISICFIKLTIKMFFISLISWKASFFFSYPSLWMFLCWLAVFSKPMSLTIWLKVKPHCNHCNHCNSGLTRLWIWEIISWSSEVVPTFSIVIHGLRRKVVKLLTMY